MTRILWLLLLVACHDETRTNAVTIPTASQSSSAAPVPIASVSAAPTSETVVVFDRETHFKSGATGRIGDVAFTIRMLPKLIVSGPQPEIEQAQIEVSRGNDHATLHVDTRHKTAEWSGVVFELGYADVYHDDIELTLHKK